MRPQIVDLARGADVLVATPGRLLDFLGVEIVSVESVVQLVVDEADVFFQSSIGLADLLRLLVDRHGLKPCGDRQTMLYSASLSAEIRALVREFLYNPITVQMGVPGSAATTVTQFVVAVTPSTRFRALLEVFDDPGGFLVFLNSRASVDKLCADLAAGGFRCAALHGGLDQTVRTASLSAFRSGAIDVLLATDVLARGLDVECVSHVVSYDMPTSIELHVHRVGRTGRIGHRGFATTFVAFPGAVEDGHCLEDVSVLQNLVGCMDAAGSDVPDWLRQLRPQSAGTGGS
jgi:superfamily II DNA/RNA helicase